MEEHVIQFTFVPPSFGIKNPTLATLNNVTKWIGFAQTKMKQEFKHMLSEWSLPPWEDNPYTKAEIEYSILRKDGRKIDSDNLAFSYKWLQDLLVENHYMVDDDKIRVVLNPTQLHVEGEIETSVHVAITLKERFKMTIPELAVKAAELDKELTVYFSDRRTKPGAARIRKILGELKNATPQLRRDLVQADKK